MLIVIIVVEEEAVMVGDGLAGCNEMVALAVAVAVAVGRWFI